jgi:hypothetical protein
MEYRKSTESKAWWKWPVSFLKASISILFLLIVAALFNGFVIGYISDEYISILYMVL